MVPTSSVAYNFRKIYKLGTIQPGIISSLLLIFSSFEENSGPMNEKSTLSRSKRLNILLVDDDEDDREMFEEAILKIDPSIKVFTLKNGATLTDYLEKNENPDLIFLDLNMPGKNGKECLIEIRKNPSWSKLPIVIYSTSANKRDINETFSGGANLYLLKPNSFKDLIKIIKHVFTIDLECKRTTQHDYLLSNGI